MAVDQDRLFDIKGGIKIKGTDAVVYSDDVNPAAAGGVAAEVSSICICTSAIGDEAGVYEKLGVADDAWEKIRALPVWSSRFIHVDPVNGDDTTADGTVGKPYATITAGAAAIPVSSSDAAGVYAWASEKAIFRLAPGEYNEGGTVGSPNNVVLNMRRARVQLTGDGVRISGEVQWIVDVTAFPYGDALETPQSPYKEMCPWPWTNGWCSPTLDIQGESAGGMEGGYTSENIMIQGAVRMIYNAVTGTIWHNRLKNNYLMVDHVQLLGGISCEGEHPAITMELNDFSCQGGYIGSINTGSFGAGLKASNGQLKSVIGPKMIVYEIDNCRIQGGFDRELDPGGGPFVGGNIDFNTSSSYSGLTDCAIPATLFKLGNGSGADAMQGDEMSMSQMATKTIDMGTGSIQLIAKDNANGVTGARPTSYMGTSTVGFRFFDTTLGQPIWWTGTAWVDATGTPA